MKNNSGNKISVTQSSLEGGLAWHVPQADPINNRRVRKLPTWLLVMEVWVEKDQQMGCPQTSRESHNRQKGLHLGTDLDAESLRQRMA